MRISCVRRGGLIGVLVFALSCSDCLAWSIDPSQLFKQYTNSFTPQELEELPQRTLLNNRRSALSKSFVIPATSKDRKERYIPAKQQLFERSLLNALEIDLKRLDQSPKATRFSTDQIDRFRQYLIRVAAAETPYPAAYLYTPLFFEGREMMAQGPVPESIRMGMALCLYHKLQADYPILDLILGLENINAYPAVLRMHHAMMLYDSLSLFRETASESLGTAMADLVVKEGITPDQEKLIARFFCKPYYHPEIALRAFLKSLPAEVEGQPDPHRWLRLIAKGRLEKEQAWEKRGGGYANTVTKDGWKEFEEHCKSAYNDLNAAWKMRPQDSEPIESIMGVLSGYCPKGVSQRIWFERAMSAEFSYSPYYDQYSWYALETRWCGAPADRLYFALSVLQNQQDHVAMLPDWLGHLRESWQRTGVQDWRVVWRVPEVQAMIPQLIAQLPTTNVFNRPVNEQVERALYELAAGHYRRAQALWATVDKTSFPSSIVPAVVTYPRKVEDIEVELALFTGKDEQTLKRAESLIFNGQDKEGTDLMEAVMNSYKDVQPAFYNYLRDRIAFTRMSNEWSSCLPAFNTMQPPLFYAAAVNDVKTARWLLDHNSDPNWSTQDNFPHSPANVVQAAARHYGSDVLKLLIERGADINAPDRWGYTPLHFSALYSNAPTLEILLNAGAKPDVAAKDQTTPIQLLIFQCDHQSENNNKSLILLAKYKINPDQVDRFGNCILATSAMRNKPLAFELLTEMGGNVDNRQNQWKMPAIMVCLQPYREYYGYRDRRESSAFDYMDRMRDVNVTDDDGRTLLYHAAVRNNGTIVEQLIARKANVEKGSFHGQDNPLLVAIRNNSARVVKLLLQNGADVMVNINGVTPLQLAQECNDSLTFEFVSAAVDRVYYRRLLIGGSIALPPLLLFLLWRFWQRHKHRKSAVANSKDSQ